MPLVATHLLRSFKSSRIVDRHCVFRLLFSWSRGSDGATWRCEAALGPGGLQRLSNRPAALSEVLRHEAPVLTPKDADALAELLGAALMPEGAPDRSSMPRWQRDARIHSTVATRFELSRIDGDAPGGVLVPVDADAWKQARHEIVPPSLELVPGGGLATFWFLDGTTTAAPGGRGTLFRALRFRCALAAGSYEIRAQCDDVGTVALMTPPRVVPGRPMLIDGVLRQAQLLRTVEKTFHRSVLSPW